ncbi:voltage-gated potassium channel [Mytilinidion resinicola]|uniref:Voltage-gated potassium channel n=1 Tax=Mytilinidion resinicola TaxID=574789 RepID=A0A6A6Y8S7_9PEZI|nr:voltage-gated potassium channel [Mytilinidion resinicola]KAF2805090.1 voltage-gated potassium channel [Mytilinidion resinicola]
MTAASPTSSQILPEKPLTSGTENSFNNASSSSHNGLYDSGPAIQLSENHPNREPQRQRRKWSFKPRKWHDGQEHDWWFASTGIPLLAATLGPLANVLSIAALVSYWRETIYIDGQFVGDFDGVSFKDPHWCYWLNVASLILGFIGNFFLLMNFTQRIRYIIALPMTIFFWYVATALLIGITACMQIYTPPMRPYETYTQGFWYAVIAACIYLVCSMILMINMLGYFLGHYPDTFALTEAQRTLILQTMMFFIWLAGGGAVFSRIETENGTSGWDFVDALYFCDVTILTVGFGDLYPTNDVSRGLIFPYSVGGIIMLGLVISSLNKFVGQLGEENLIQKHVEKQRVRTMDRTVTNSFDLHQREGVSPSRQRHISKADISAPHRANEYPRSAMGNTGRHRAHRSTFRPIPLRPSKPKLLLLREEKDRFDQMRSIQHATHKFKKWWALTLSVIAFGILWCVGAVVFWQCEKTSQDMTYFQALYFCYVSLLTIGYGDLSPKTNAGRAFFVVWSLIAVPTMTVLISDMGDTVISNFKNFITNLADFTVLPKEGIWRSFLDRHPWLLRWMQRRVEKRAAKKRLEKGFPTGPDPESAAAEEEDTAPPNIENLAEEAERDAISDPALDEATLSRKLALAIRNVANDLTHDPPRKYSYEEWVEFTRLIRFTTKSAEEVEAQEEEEGLVEWDWIGEDSPLVSKKAEAEFVLDRLCESLARYMRRKSEAKGAARKQIESLEEKVEELEDLEGEMRREMNSSGANGTGSSRAS